MRYEMWEATIDEAAAVTGGTVEELGGGYKGVKVPGDGFTLMLTLDMDDESGWVCWNERADGSRCCDNCYINLGWVRLNHLAVEGFAALILHKCA
jgi:hypothetical protein